MVIKLSSIAILLLIALTTIFSTCKKGGLGCADTLYSFQIPEMITPDEDSTHIGDTIFLKVLTSTTVSDIPSGQMIDYSNTENLGNVLTFLRFSPDNTTAGAISNFNFDLMKGSDVKSADPLSQKEVLFAEANGYYTFSLAIIAKDTGRYALTISDAANVYRKNDQCTKAGFAINFTNTNQHFYLLNKWRPDLTLDDNGKKHVYYFKVY